MCWWNFCCGGGCLCNQALQFSDGFNGNLPQWVTSPDFPSANFFRTGGRLWLEDSTVPPDDISSEDDGARYIEVDRPALDGLKMCVAARCYSVARTDNASNIRTSTVGIFIGGAVAFAARARFTPLGSPTNRYLRGDADENGDHSGDVLFDGDFGVAGGLLPGDYSDLSLSIVDTSSGGGLYKVTFCADGVMLRQETDVALTITDPLNVGILATDSASWDNFAWRSNA